MQLGEAKAELERHRGRTDIRLDELLAIANDLINLVVPAQPSERVAETLNERNLRYYITQGLIDRPSGKEGTSALYGYRHLLQALIVKALQWTYLPIKRIKEILAGKNDRDLEAILACQTLEIPQGKNELGPLDTMVAALPEMDMHTARQKALSYLDNLAGSPRLPQPAPKIVCVEPSPQEIIADAPNLSQSSGRRPSDYQEFPDSDSWERFFLADGIELHVRADRVKRLRTSEIKRILEKLLKLLKTGN